MKKFLISILSILLIFGIAFGGTALYTKDRTDSFSQKFNRYNPLIQDKSIYVKIDNSNARDNEGYGDYTYNLVGYDKDGNSQNVEFVSLGGKLTEGAYLDLNVHGTFVKNFKSIDINNIPQPAAEKVK